MNTLELTDRLDHAYKLRMPNGKWSPYLRFVKEAHGRYAFKPVEDTESTLEHHIISVFIGNRVDVENGRHFIMNKKYAEWEPASRYPVRVMMTQGQGPIMVGVFFLRYALSYIKRHQSEGSFGLKWETEA